MTKNLIKTNTYVILSDVLEMTGWRMIEPFAADGCKERL
jgi:hypothetical protein